MGTKAGRLAPRIETARPSIPWPKDRFRIAGAHAVRARIRTERLQETWHQPGAESRNAKRRPWPPLRTAWGLGLTVQARGPVRAHRGAEPAVGFADRDDVDGEDRVGTHEAAAEERPSTRLVGEVPDDLACVLARLLRIGERADRHPLAVGEPQ